LTPLYHSISVHRTVYDQCKKTRTFSWSSCCCSSSNSFSSEARTYNLRAGRFAGLGVSFLREHKFIRQLILQTMRCATGRPCPLQPHAAHSSVFQVENEAIADIAAFRRLSQWRMSADAAVVHVCMYVCLSVCYAIAFWSVGYFYYMSKTLKMARLFMTPNSSGHVLQIDYPNDL
jgi:hypothetical protein